MSNSLIPARSQGMTISEDNPFKTEIMRHLNAMKESNRTTTMQGLASEEMIITYKRSYFPGAWCKMYQNKELLDDLSPAACKVLIHIALNTEFNQEKIQIKSKDIGMDRRTIGKAIVELIGARIIYKEKQEWYWLNVSVLIVGHLNKPQS